MAYKESKTGESYKSKAQMMRHEKMEGLKERLMEYGNKAVAKGKKMVKKTVKKKASPKKK